jgi:hypothetical protein
MSDEATNDTKPFWQSRAIIGSAVTIAALIAGFYKIKIDVGNLTDIVVQIAGLLGAALAIYGRIKATQPIAFTGGTKPGGPFNPEAEVKKAEVAKPETADRKSESGAASQDTLLLVAVIFILLGMFVWAIPAHSSPRPLIEEPEPEVIAHRAVCKWMQIVRIEDSRPFLTRLLASIHCTPTAALVTTASGTSPQITKIEITGGAQF